MEVVFYFACSSLVTPERVLPEIMVRTCREHMDCKIVQCTDLYTPEVDGVDECVRFPSRRTFFESKPHAFAEYECGDALYVDCDIVFLDDVSDVWEKDFEFAVKGANPNLKALDAEPGVFDPPNKNAFEQMPYNMGVLFSRDQSYWKNVVENWPEGAYRWYEEQIVECDALRERDVLELDESCHFVPQYFLQDLTGQKVVHFKGIYRKLWMAKRFGHAPLSLGAIKKVKYNGTDDICGIADGDQ